MPMSGVRSQLLPLHGELSTRSLAPAASNATRMAERRTIVGPPLVETWADPLMETGRSKAQCSSQPGGDRCGQKLREKTSAWFSVAPVVVVTMLRLSPQVAKRRVPFEATWL